MADPTKKTREAVAQAIVPKSSPLGQSMSESKKKEEEQIAVDEANNLVLQREQPQLPAEAQAFANPQAAMPAQAQPEQKFVNPGQQAQPERTTASVESPVAQQASPGPSIPNQDAELNKAHAGFQDEAKKIDADIEANQKAKEAAIQEKMDADDKYVETVKPTDIFAGKATWQKIVGGIGMFLGSLTPEGAKNIAGMIDKEIERDQNLQLQNIRLKRDKEDRHFKMLLEKYGSKEAALLAKKRDAYTAMDLYMKKLATQAQGAEARAKIAQGQQAIDLQRQQISKDLLIAQMKTQQDANKGSVPGFYGTNQNPSIVKDFSERVAAQNSANKQIDELERLLKEGALTPGTENYKLAVQARDKLAADLAKAMFGRSSDTELDVARGLIPDITSLFQRGSVDKSLLSGLRKKLASDVEAAGKAYGFTRMLPPGAKVTQ